MIYLDDYHGTKGERFDGIASSSSCERFCMLSQVQSQAETQAELI